jgi:alkylation response protein AidB-like acyl-CoA dehydrogenase
MNGVQSSTTEPDTDLEGLRQELRGWLDGAWDPGLTVREWWARLADSGWAFPTWPAEWFGRGLSPLEREAVVEELASAGALGPPIGSGTAMGSAILLAYGSDEQKREWLPRLARGDEYWCQFFSEPGAGSDLASVQTRAVRDGDEWVVNGQKVWNSGTLAADRGLLLVRTDSEVPKHRGMTYFIIDVDQPGIEVRPIRQINGRAEFNETFFTDARVSDRARIGDVGDGFRVAMTTLANERSTYAAGGDHRLRSCTPGEKGGNLSRTVADVLGAYEAEHIDFGNTPPISTPQSLIALARTYGRASDPVIRQRIAAAFALSEALRFTALRAKERARAGHAVDAESSISYLGGVRFLRLCRDLCAEIAGPAALIAGPDGAAGGDVVTTLLTVPCHGIQGGSEQIQMNIIGERILGLPKEPQVDRDVPFKNLKVGTQRA